jgi:hypothetical protein
MPRALAVLLILSVAAPATAQERGFRVNRPAPETLPKTLQPTPLGRMVAGNDLDAQQTQRRFQELLRQYPPSLAHVLALDPTLLTNETYLEPYQALSDFLAQHPEIPHNPGFFLDGFAARERFDFNDPKVAAMRTVNDSLAGIAFLIGFLAVVGTITWLLRTAIEYRRWQRVTKTQNDIHAKLIDRLTSNEDLMAYMESPAGRRFLEAAPIVTDAGPRALAAPLGRILTSMQAGFVVAFLGGGLIWSSSRVASSELFSELRLPLFIMGAAAFAVGLGFLVSSTVAFGLTWRLGLFSRPEPPSDDRGSGQASGKV